MLKRHFDGLLAYFTHWITNTATEGFNSRIQSIKAAARGFRNFEHYRIRILFFCTTPRAATRSHPLKPRKSHEKYPFIAYGTDWLAFGHLMIALFFILPWRDPVRYEGVLWVGIWLSILVIPLALTCGPIRGIPFWWRMIDCSFGVFCIPPLGFALRKVKTLGSREPLIKSR